MPAWLSRRAAHASEQMDNPHCDLHKLENTYRQFRHVNRLFAAWRRVYTRYLRPLMQTGEPATLLDVGCGGADIPRRLSEWARADGLYLMITAIDPDPRVMAFVQRQAFPDNIRFRAQHTEELMAEGARFDFVVSNNVLHHLSVAQVQELCRHSEVLCRRRALHNDIERGDLAYAFFWLLTAPFFHDSFITTDGLVSIRRSYTRPELRRAASAGWRVEGAFPYRNLLIYDAPA